MLETYRTLAAMLLLPEFTRADLVRASAVNESTVQTVLRRSDLVEEIGRRETGRRGGQPTVLRLRPGAYERIRAELKRLEDVGQARDPDVAAQVEVPSSLRAAQDVLLRQFPEVAADEQADVLGLAESYLDDGEAALESRSEGPFRDDSSLHAAVGRFLLRFSDAETNVSLSEEEARDLGVEFLRLRLSLLVGHEDNRALAADLDTRVRQSRHGAAVLEAEPAVIALRPARAEFAAAVHRFVIVDATGEGDDLPRVVESLLRERLVGNRAGAVEVLALASAELAAVAEDEGVQLLVVMDNRRQQDARGYWEQLESVVGSNRVAVIARGSSPNVREEVYARPYSTYVDVSGLSRHAVANAVENAAEQVLAGLGDR